MCVCLFGSIDRFADEPRFFVLLWCNSKSTALTNTLIFFFPVLFEQFVCVVATRATVEEGIWHKRQAPSTWLRQPPFHVRIVRPNPVGMLGHMLGTGKIKFVQKVHLGLLKRLLRTFLTCACVCVFFLECSLLFCSPGLEEALLGVFVCAFWDLHRQR